MNGNALGMVETKGLVAAIEAADAMAKAANVEIVGNVRVGSAFVCILIRGDVGAVTAAVDVGAQAAKPLGQLIASVVIPRPHPDVESMLPVAK